jgi:hypothetical protein
VVHQEHRVRQVQVAHLALQEVAEHQVLAEHQVRDYVTHIKFKLH